jgi:hypothetical protein
VRSSVVCDSMCDARLLRTNQYRTLLNLDRPVPAGTDPGGRARFNVGSAWPFRFATMTESITSPHNRHCHPEMDSPLTTSFILMICRNPSQRKQIMPITWHLPRSTPSSAPRSCSIHRTDSSLWQAARKSSLCCACARNTTVMGPGGHPYDRSRFQKARWRSGGDWGIRRAGRNHDARGIGQSARLSTSYSHTGRNEDGSQAL